jgi:general stress protein YciG
MRITPAEREILRKIGRKGGKARAAALTPQRRSEIASIANAANQARRAARRQTAEK